MSHMEIMPSVRQLSTVEKRRLIQSLAEELASTRELPCLEAGQSYPVWSPHISYDAAAILL